jgi:2-aminoadipate transaminase
LCKSITGSGRKGIETYLPATVGYTHPEGGMFIWLTLPQGASSKRLFDLAIQDKVAFVLGSPLYRSAGDRYFEAQFFLC